MSLDEEFAGESNKKIDYNSYTRKCTRVELTGGKMYFCKEKERAPKCKRAILSNNVYYCEAPSKEK